VETVHQGVPKKENNSGNVGKATPAIETGEAVGAEQNSGRDHATGRRIQSIAAEKESETLCQKLKPRTALQRAWAVPATKGGPPAGCNQQKRMLSQEDGSVPTESMHYERAPRLRKSDGGRRLRSATLCRASLRSSGFRFFINKQPTGPCPKPVTEITVGCRWRHREHRLGKNLRRRRIQF
jgi:hypothetical protein